MITNGGEVAMEWGVESDHAAMEMDINGGSLGAGDSVQVSAIFNCAQASSFEANLLITALNENDEEASCHR